jgi:hypothetical protein
VFSYPAEVSHPLVTDVDNDPFDAGFRPQAGERIWAASTQGARQTLTWDVDDGDWSIVVMNADGSPGVQADISAGAALAVFAVRPPRDRSRKAQTTGLAPSAR